MKIALKPLLGSDRTHYTVLGRSNAVQHTVPYAEFATHVAMGAIHFSKLCMNSSIP